MIVKVKSGVVVGPKNSYNEFFVLPETKISSNLISSQGNLLQKDDDENPEKIMVDAASSFSQNVNVGDRFTDPIIGIMDYSYGNYKIGTILDPKIIITKNSITPIKPGSEVTLSIVSYNLENFSIYDMESRNRGISCQIVKGLGSPDISMLHEVMDDSGTVDDRVISSGKTLKRLSDEISACGGPTYAYSDNPPIDGKDGGIEGGNIRTVLFYRTDSGINLESSEGGKRGLRIEQGEIILSNNPLRLFESDSAFLGTRKPELEKRVEQARIIKTYIAGWEKIADDLNILLVGDLNDYSWSSTLKDLESTPLIDLGSLLSDDERFSYIHEGNSFQFDYALVSAKLRERVETFTIAHINTFLVIICNFQIMILFILRYPQSEVPLNGEY